MSIPAGALPAGTTVGLTSRPLTPTELTSAHLPPGVRPGPVAEVKLNGAAEPTEAATITFPAPAGSDTSTSLPVVFWQDEAGGWRWLPVTYTAGAATVTAQVDHFSIGFLANIDINRWAKDRASALTRYLSGRAGVRQPSCGDEKAARAGGVRVTSDGGDTVKWCFGQEHGHRVLKVANNRRTYTQIAYPRGWRVVDGPAIKLEPESIDRTLGTKAAELTYPAGYAARLIDGGDTLTLQLPDSTTSGQVRAEFATTAWLLSAIRFGVETYAAVASLAGGAVKEQSKNSWKRIVKRLAGAEDMDGYTEALRSCGEAMAGTAGHDLVREAGPVVKGAFKCIPALMKADITEAGVRMFALGIVLTAIGTAVGLILTAVHLIVTGVREVIDNVASIGSGGKSDTVYDIWVKAPTLMLSRSTVGPAKIGTPAGDALRQITALLGAGHLEYHRTYCELGMPGETSSVYSWGGLQVRMSDERGTGMRLVGWQVRPGSRTPPLTTQFGIRLGMSETAARRALVGQSNIEEFQTFDGNLALGGYGVVTYDFDAPAGYGAKVSRINLDMPGCE